MAWAAVGSAVAGAVISSAMAPSPGQGAAAAGAADPYALQRGQYQNMLNQFMAGGITPQDSSYKFRFNEGLNAMNAQLAATGGGGPSGAAMLEAQKYGQGFASTEYQNQFNRLAKLAGVDAGSPAAAGGILQQQYQTQQQIAGSTGNMVAGLVGKGINAWLSPSNPSTAPTPSYSSGSSMVPYNPSPNILG